MCDLCKPTKKEVKTSDSSTSNLRAHLKHNHPLQFAELDSKRCAKQPSALQAPEPKRRCFSQPLITQSIERMTKYNKDSTKFKAIVNKITNLLVKQMIPTSVVDTEEWRELMTELDTRFDCPGRKFFSNNAIPAKYTRVKEQVMLDLKHATTLSCTTDGWSSVTTDPYLSLTAHFFTPEWQLRTYCLRTIYLPESHTGDNIARMIRNILAEYNLYISDVTSFTTDNGSNMKSAIKKLEAVRIPCFGHILHNAINVAVKDVKDIQEMLKACRQLVSTLNHCFRLKNELKKKQKEAALPVKNLIGECSTRWGSKFDMVKRMFDNVQSVQNLLINDRKYADMVPSYERVMVMEMFIHTLEPFHQLTDAMSAEKSVSVSSVWRLLQHIKRVSSTDITCDVTESLKRKAREVRASIWKYIDERYEHEKEFGPSIARILKICSYLDPRFVKDMDHSVKTDVQVEAIALECAEQGEPDDSLSQSQSTSSVVAIPKQSTSSLMSLLLSSSDSETSAVPDDAQTRAENELDYYHQIAPSMITHEEDISVWWKEKGSQFPMLQRVARKFLTINATSTASERLFSLAGNIASKKRNRLKPTNVDMLSCLAYNLKKNPHLQ